RAAPRTAAISRLRADLLHLCHRGSRRPRAVRHRRSGRGRGAATPRPRGGDRGAAPGDRAPAHIRSWRGADAAVGRPGQRRPSDLCAEDQPAGRRALLLRAVPHALAPPGLRIHRIADPPVPSPCQRPTAAPEEPTLTGGWRPAPKTLVVIGLLIGAVVLLSIGRPRSIKPSGATGLSPVPPADR